MAERATGVGLVGNVDRMVLEVGCGTADISGWLATNLMGWHAYGIDCHGQSLLEATLRYHPHFTPIHSAIAPVGDGPLVDLVILSEVLEHLNDCEAVAASWLKRARASVISHPLDEPIGSMLSGQDHCWSFSIEDFHNWFTMGGHELIEEEQFQMGSYNIVLGRGVRKQ
jgi:hypothetical protein